MHRLHCGSNKVRRGSWPPQVSFVSRILPPTNCVAWRGAAPTEWPWPWATRPTAVWWAWWAAPGWRCTGSARPPARRRHSNAPIWLLRSSAESWEQLQPAAGGLARWACTGASGRAGWRRWWARRYSRMNRHRPKALVSRSWPCSAARRWPWIAPLQTLCYILRG